MYMVSTFVIVQQYGLPEILSLLSRVDVVPRDLQYNAGASAIAQHTVRSTSATIGSDPEWPTPTSDVRPVVTEPLRMVASWSRNQWIHNPYITHTFDHKANMYSKPMAITTTCTGVPCHTLQIILSVFYMYVILQVSLD
jgi:hypothetical protein